MASKNKKNKQTEVKKPEIKLPQMPIAAPKNPTIALEKREPVYTEKETEKETPDWRNYKQISDLYFKTQSSGQYEGNDVRLMSQNQLSKGLEKLNTDKQAITQKAGNLEEAWNRISSPTMKNDTLHRIAPFTERPEDYNDYAENNDRILYDFYFGKGAYDKIENEGSVNRDAMLRRNEQIKELWHSIDNGEMAEVSEANDWLNGRFPDVHSASVYDDQIAAYEKEIENRSRISELEGNVPQISGTYDPSRVNWTMGGDSTDQVYYYANRDLNREGATDFERYGVNRPESFMTAEQLDVFNKYYLSGDKASAKAYYEALEPYLRMMQLDYKNNLEYEMSQNGYAPEMIIQRLATKPVEGAVGTVAAALAGTGLVKDFQNPENPVWDMTRSNRNIQNARAKVWGNQFQKWFGNTDFAKNAGEFLNGVVYSIADNIIAVGAAGGGAGFAQGGMAEKIAEGAIQFVMSSEATAGEMLEKLESGMDPTEAALYAFGGGIIEAITEKYSIEQLLKPNVRELLGTKGAFLKYLAKNTAAEGAEEVASDVLQSGLDYVLSALYGHKNEFEQNIFQLMKDNPDMSEKEAAKKVWSDYLLQLGTDGLAGSLSGLLMSGTRGVETRVKVAAETKNIGKNISNESNTSEGKTGTQQLMDVAIGMNGTQSQKLAQEMAKGIERGETPSNFNVGKLATTVLEETQDKYKQTVRDVITRDIREQMVKEGVPEGVALNAAAAVVNIMETGKASQVDITAIAKDNRAMKVWQSYNTNPAKQAALTKNIEEATAPQRSVAEKISDLTGKNFKGTGALAADIDAANRESGSNEEAVDNLHSRLGGIISEKFAQAAKDVLNSSETAKNSKSFLDDMVKIRLGAYAMRTTMPKTKMDTESAQKLWDAAKAEFAEEEAKRVVKQRIVTPGKGTATYNGISYDSDAWKAEINGDKTLTGRQKLYMHTVAEIAKRMGMTVNFINESGVNKKGVKMEDVYGSENQTTGAVTVNIAGLDDVQIVHNAVVTVAHEFTHWLEQNSRNGYAALRQFVMDELRTQGVDVESELIQSINIQNSVLGAESGESLDLYGAVAEMVARGSEGLFTSAEMRNRLANQDEGLYNKVKTFVRQFVARLNAAIRGIDTSLSREARTLKAKVDEIAKLWLEGYDEALGRSEEGAEATEGERFSTARRELQETARRAAVEHPAVDVDNDNSLITVWGKTVTGAAKNAARYSVANNKTIRTLKMMADERILNDQEEMQKILSKYKINTRNGQMAESSVMDYAGIVSKKDLQKLQQLQADAERWQQRKGEYDSIDENDPVAKYMEAWNKADMEAMQEILDQTMLSTQGVIPFKAAQWYNTDAHAWVANAIKQKDPVAIMTAAAEMAELVPDNAVLIPIPNHNGVVNENTDTMVLARAISQLTGRPVVNALAGVERESRRDSKGDKARSKVTAADMGFRQTAEIPAGTIPYFIDNVVGSGETAKAAHDAFGTGITLAYAKSTRAAIDGLKWSRNEIYGKGAVQFARPLDQRADLSMTGAAGVRYSTAQRDKKYFDNILTNHPNIDVAVINNPMTVPTKADGSIDTQKVLLNARKSKNVRSFNNNGKMEDRYYVRVPDLGFNVEIPGKGLRHNFSRKSKERANNTDNALIAQYAGDILPYAVEVNRGKAHTGTGEIEHVLVAGVQFTANGKTRDFAVRFIVDEKKGQQAELVEAEIIGTLNAIKERKAAFTALGNNARNNAKPSISIKLSKFFEDVKNGLNDTFADAVYKNAGMNRANTEFSEKLMYSTAQRDQNYKDAVNSGDMETAQHLVNDAAKAAGYTVRAYHGTNLFGFTEFNLKAGGNMLFVAFDQKLASTYTETENVRRIKDRNGVPKNHYVMNDTDFLAYAKETLKTLGGGSRVVDIRPIEAKNWTGVNKKFEVEYEDPFDKAFYGKDTSTSIYRRHELNDLIMSKINKLGETDGIYDLYTRPGNQLVIDAKGANWNRISNESILDATEYDAAAIYDFPDGTEYNTREVAEWARDNGYDSVRINNLYDNGGRNGMVTREEARGDIGIFFNENDVKSADPVVYDDNGDAIPLSERFNPKTNDIRFSLKQNVEVNRDGLIAVHNLTKKNLIDTLKEGGFTAPSIAVVLAKMGHSKFGPISAVFKPSAIDPRRSIKNKIYGTDAWTPTRSNAQIETKLDYQVLQDARDTIESLLQDERDVWKNEAMNWINQWLYEDQTTDTLEEMIEKARRNDGMVAAFEIAQGRELKEKTRAEKVRSDLYADKVHIYEDFLNHLEEKGMLQEFLNDLHNVNGNVLLDKYIDLFAESNDVAAKQVKAYKEKSEGLAKRVIFNTMRQSGIYEEDGREIKMVDVFNKIDTANSIRRQWIENKSRRDEFNNWVTGMIGKALGKKGVYNGKEKFTSSGNKRSFEALHMEPTAENIVKAMYTNHPAKGGEAGGATGLMAKASKEYGSLQDVREDAARLQMIQDEEYKKLINALDDKLSDLVQRVSDGIGMDYYTIKEELIEAAGNYAKNPTAAAIRRYMEKEGIKLTAEQLIEAQELMEEARNIPTGYFEAKPESVKGFDELQTIIMTEDEELEQMLTERGIHYDIYDGTEEDRLRILNEQTDVQFSVKQQDMEVTQFMLGLNEDNMTTAQEKTMVRQFKELNMALKIERHALNDRTKQLKALEAKTNPSAFDRKEIIRLRNLIDNNNKKLSRLEGQMVKATTDEGYARLMYQQEQNMRNTVSGRTSEEVRATIEALTRQVAAVSKEIDTRQKDIDSMRNDLSFKKTSALVDSSAADKVAAMIRKMYNSRINKQDLIRAMTEIRLKIAAGKNIDAEAEELAWKVLSDATMDGGESLKRLRGTVIKLGKGQVKELLGSNSSMKELRSLFAGSGIQVRMARDGEVGLDGGSWEELCNIAPELDRNATELEQVNELIRFVQNQKQQMSGAEQYRDNIDEVVMDLKGWIASIGVNTPQDPGAMKILDAMNKLINEMATGISGSAKQLDAVKAQLAELVDQGKLAISMTDRMQRDVEQAIRYNNTLAEQSEAALWKSEKWKLIEQLKSENTQNLLKEQEKWKEKIAKDKQARQMMQSNQQLRKLIHTNVTRVAKLIFNETDLKNMPEHMKGLAREMIELIMRNDVNGRKITGIERKDLLNNLRTLDIMRNQDGGLNMDDIAQIHDEEAQDMVLDALADIEDGIKYYNASTGKDIIANLQAFHNALDRIAEAVATITNVIHAEQSVNIGDRKVAITEAAGEIIYDMSRSRFKGEVRGRGSKAINATKGSVVYGNMTPVYFFKNLMNRGMMKQWGELKRGQNRNGLETQKAADFLQGLAEKTNFKSWADQTHKVKIGNRDMTLTVGNIMEIYAIWQREQISKEQYPEMSSHMEVGGIYIDEDERTEGKLRREKQNMKAMRLNKQIVEDMYDLLTDDQKLYLNEVVKYLSSEMSELGNEASMKMYGIKKYKESWYFPMKVWDGVKSARSDKGISGSNENRAAHKGWSNRRVNNASNALVIGDFTKDAVTHIVEMINYNTMSPAIENFNKILNYQQKEIDETGVNEGDEYYVDVETPIVKRNVRIMFQEAYGKQALNYLETFLKDLNGGMVQDQRSTLRDRMISVFRKNAVAGSLSVTLQQPLSYIRAAMMISPKHLMQAVSPTYWKGSHAEMVKYSGVAVIKNMGRFDMNFGQSAKDYVAPDRKESVYGKVSNTLTVLPELADRMTWTRMWSAVKIEQHELHPEMDMKSEEFLQLVAERFNDVMMATQVYDSVLVKSHNMRSTNGLMKMATSFMAEPTLSLNVLSDAVLNVKEKGGKAMLGKAVATFALGAVLQAFFKGLMGSGRTPDDKKTWAENFLYKWYQNFISEINPANLIPGYSDLIEVLKTGELSDDAMGVLGKAKTAIVTVRDAAEGNGKGVYRDIEDSAAQIAQLFTNIPYKNIMRDMRAMYNWVSGDSYAKRDTSAAVLRKQTEAATWSADNLMGTINTWLGEAGFKTSNTAYYKRLYEARERGDEQEAAEIREYLMLGKGVEEKTISSKLGSMYYKDLWTAMDNNKAEEIGDVIKRLTGEGKQPKDIKSQITSHYKDAYLAADSAGKRRIRDAIQKAYKKMGLTAEDADKVINGWK